MSSVLTLEWHGLCDGSPMPNPFGWGCDWSDRSMVEQFRDRLQAILEFRGISGQEAHKRGWVWKEKVDRLYTDVGYMKPFEPGENGGTWVAAGHQQSGRITLPWQKDGVTPFDQLTLNEAERAMIARGSKIPLIASVRDRLRLSVDGARELFDAYLWQVKRMGKKIGEPVS